ncbi:MAG TPA: type II toxin-antitoxin system VapC family toxin [Terriglobia bacterium]|nr:type II toxin-antitoxin system VapC family toxin [Terriglobia bacterium]
MNAYPDTSFLVSLYVSDVHTPKAELVMHRVRPILVLTLFHQLELTNALQLLVFRGLISAAQASAAQRRFEENLAVLGPLRSLPNEVFSQAVDLAKRHTARSGTRSLDILHVAAALSLDAEVFLTFDLRQRRLAKAAGLRIGR